MEQKLKLHLEQISALISRLKSEDLNLDKLIELDKSLELLSQNIKTVRLEQKPSMTEDIHNRQDAVFYIDEEFNVVRIIGTLENIVGKNFEDSYRKLDSLFAPDSFDTVKQKAKKVFKDGVSEVVDSKLITNNNLLLPVKLLLEKIKLGNREYLAAGINFYGHNPSELIDYQSILFENIPGLDVYLFDVNYRHVIAGGSEKKLLNLKNADFIGKTLFEVYNEKVQKRIFPFYKNAIEGLYSEGEIRIKKHTFFVSATPVYDINNEVVGGTLIIQNISKEKEVEERLLKAKKDAEESERAKSIFLVNMSHEIRTPLNSIIGFSNLLKKTELSPKQKKYSFLIDQSAQHLLSVVNEILFLFKLGMGKVFIEKIPFNIYDLVKNVYDILQIKASEKKLKFTYELEEQVSEILIGDPYRVKQVLMNIVANAIKFTDKGEVFINVSVEKTSKKKILIRFNVKDTGIGISEKDQEIIFDEFSQSEIGSAKQRKGTGLGLTISKKIVELLKGNIYLKSEINKGTKFSFTIPFEKVTHSEKPLQENDFDISFDLLEGKKVLYADDDENNILLGESILTEWKTDFKLAYDGREALEFIKNERFDIILLDIHMPEYSGLEIIKKVRKNQQGINYPTKIMAVTANILESDIKKYIKSGFNDYILKPFSEEMLYNKICSLLNLENINHKEESGKLNKNQENTIDFTSLLQNARGDIVFFEKMLDTFKTNAKNSIKKFQTGLEKENWEDIGEVAHKAISSFRFFELSAIAGDLAQLEDLALKEKNYEEIPKITIGVINSITKVLTQIENIEINKMKDNK